MNDRPVHPSRDATSTQSHGPYEDGPSLAERSFRELTIDVGHTLVPGDGKQPLVRTSDYLAAPNRAITVDVQDVDTLPPSGSTGEHLVIEEGQDYVLEENNRLPFTIEMTLGSGHSAIVEKVQDIRTGTTFAKKTIRFTHNRLRAQKEEQFYNEVKIIRSLKKHRHIIWVFATYVAKRDFGLILQPAAEEGALDQYLGNYLDVVEQTESLDAKIAAMTLVLQRAFGCLANGLEYIHAKGIRHKDIKPQNILVHRGSVIYMDFGSSKDATKPGESTTEGVPDFLTRKYSPPEVLAYTKRNYAADIYSLGCVYIELLSALFPAFKYEEGRMFPDIMEYVHHELRTTPLPLKWSGMPGVITAMTATDRESRPTAAHIYGTMSGHIELFCSECHQISQPKPTYTPWTWSEAHRRYYSYVMGPDGVVIDILWSTPEATSTMR
jgi:serine/threonine protein kinase